MSNYQYSEAAHTFDAAARSIAAHLNAGRTYENHPSHSFTGEEGRCMYCDCRAYGRHAPNPCEFAY